MKTKKKTGFIDAYENAIYDGDILTDCCPGEVIVFKDEKDKKWKYKVLSSMVPSLIGTSHPLTKENCSYHIRQNTDIYRF